MNYALLFSGLFFGILTARAGAVGARGGIEPSPNLIRLIINTASLISVFAVIVWGFMNLAWWVTIFAFIIISLIVGAIVTRLTWALIYQVMPVTGLVTVGITVAAWIL